MTKTKQCLVCDCEVVIGLNGTTLRAPYRIHNLSVVCFDCGDTCSKFVDYWGKKKLKDKINLKSFLNSGVLPARKFQMQMNGGYCE